MDEHRLESRVVGALPVLQHVCRAIRLAETIDEDGRGPGPLPTIAGAADQLGPVHLGVRVDRAAHELNRVGLGKPLENALL